MWPCGHEALTLHPTPVPEQESRQATNIETLRQQVLQTKQSDILFVFPFGATHAGDF